MFNLAPKINLRRANVEKSRFNDGTPMKGRPMEVMKAMSKNYHEEKKQNFLPIITSSKSSQPSKEGSRLPRAKAHACDGSGHKGKRDFFKLGYHPLV